MFLGVTQKHVADQEVKAGCNYQIYSLKVPVFHVQEIVQDNINSLALQGEIFYQEPTEQIHLQSQEKQKLSG